MTNEQIMMSKDIVDIINSSKKENRELTGKKIQEFYKKYSYYYEDNRVRQKLNFYKENLYNETKINRIKKEETNLKRLKKVINIYNSDISDYNKIEKISKYYNSYNEFWESYYDLIIPFLKTKFIKDLNKVYMFLKKNNDILDFVSYYSSTSKLENSYKYAEFIINLYIDNNISYNLESFLNEIGIDIKTFNYCIYVIEELDVDLYNKFIKIKNKNDLIELEYNKMLLDDFIYALNNREYKDKTELTITEFFKRIPFKYDRNFYNTLIKFTSIYYPDQVEIVQKYLKSNTIHRKETTKELDVNELMNMGIMINRRFVTEEQKRKTLTYMQDNNLPMFKIVFYDILERYVKNELDLIEIKEVKRKKILIP